MIKKFACSLWLSALLLGGAAQAWATAAVVWHIPDNSTDLGGTHMRNPWIEISNNPASPTSITIYQGIFKGAGANENNGGVVFYKGQSQSVWSSVPLGFDRTSGSNQFWKASFSTAGIPANDPIQYYIHVTTDNSAGFGSTFIYAPIGFGDHGGQTLEGAVFTNSPQQAIAAASPFTIRNRPGWIFHANNRVASGNDMQFWAKVGYIGDPNNTATKWVTNGAIYYTTDGSDPVIGATPGTATSPTQVATFSYDHPENTSQNGSGQSVAGTAMWWMASVPNLANLPFNTTVKYKIGFWNTANNEQKFGDYNAGDANYQGRIFSFSNGVSGAPTLTVSSPTTGTLSGNYTTTKVFVDEIAGTTVPITVAFAPGEAATQVEIVTNLNQRDQVTADKNSNTVDDGMEFNETEGIIGPDASYYYRSYPLANPVSGVYTTVFNAARTGAYRLTARWKVSGDPNWRWYTNSAAARRDHAITVSPTDARDINLYEINTLTIEANDSNAQGLGGFIDRSTFEDLWDGPGAPRTADGRGFNLDYLTGLGINWLWFQPIHPPAVAGREIDPATNAPYNPGSPYAVKNFFEINPWMSANYNGTDPINGGVARNQGMESFQGFVAAADGKSVGVMLDAPFNHTGWDVELADPGVELFQRDGAATSATTEIRNYDTRFFSKAGDYAQRATNAPNYVDIATAPDRGDFGKWADVKDVYFGRYDALVNTNPSNDGNYLNEGDRFFYAAPGAGTANNPENGNWTANDFTQNGVQRNVTKQVWKYFARYPVYWLAKTRPPGHNRNSSTEAGLTTSQRYAWDRAGIDGLRADFGQGLPPQLWEYIINQARSCKWNFVAMSESLDGGAVTYRSNRHFDILNENIVFPLKSAGNTPDYRAIFEGRRSAYGQGLVLLNNTSHDEENYENIFFPVMRYEVANTVDGAPMIFMGQELGITRTSGFSFYETNFGKQVAHFKKFNSMKNAWLKRLPVAQGGFGSQFGEKFLFDAFAPAGQARQFSPALRSSNRWYLNRKSDGQPRNEIWAVAKYDKPGVSPSLQDAVLAFVNLRTDAASSDTFDVNISSGGPNLLGLQAGRNYNIRNIAAFTGGTDKTRRTTWLWGAAGKTGSEILANGVFVSLNPVPASDAQWETAPYEAQYLKLYDIAAPNTPAPVTPNAFGYSIGSTVTFTWNADPNVNAVYTVNVTVNGNTSSFSTSSTSYVYSGQLGDVVSISLRATNADNNSAQSSTSTSSPTFKLISASADQDGDGMSNASEDFAGTNPFSPGSILRVTNVARTSATSTTITWNSVPGKRYQVEKATDLSQADPFSPLSTVNASNGATTSYLDTTNNPGPAFYRVRVIP